MARNTRSTGLSPEVTPFARRSFKSTPAQYVDPSARNTISRSAGAGSAVKTSCNASSIAVSMALRFSGRVRGDSFYRPVYLDTYSFAHRRSLFKPLGALLSIWRSDGSTIGKVEIRGVFPDYGESVMPS